MYFSESNQISNQIKYILTTQIVMPMNYLKEVIVNPGYRVRINIGSRYPIIKIEVLGVVPMNYCKKQCCVVKIYLI